MRHPVARCNARPRFAHTRRCFGLTHCAPPALSHVATDAGAALAGGLQQAELLLMDEAFEHRTSCCASTSAACASPNSSGTTSNATALAAGNAAVAPLQPAPAFAAAAASNGILAVVPPTPSHPRQQQQQQQPPSEQRKPSSITQLPVWGALVLLSVSYTHQACNAFSLPVMLPAISSELHLDDLQGAMLTTGFR